MLDRKLFVWNGTNYLTLQSFFPEKRSNLQVSELLLEKFGS